MVLRGELAMLDSGWGRGGNQYEKYKNAAGTKTWREIMTGRFAVRIRKPL